MAGIVSLTGTGARGSAGLRGNDTEGQGHIVITFDAMPWEQQPSLQGSITIRFQGNGPRKVVPLDGWALLDPHLGQETIIAWTCQRPPQIGDSVEIWYEG